MEEKLEKVCRVKNARLNERYSLCKDFHIYYAFVVKEITCGHVYVKYLDSTPGIFLINDDIEIFEYPLSSLEKELL